MANYSTITSNKDYVSKANQLAKRGHSFAADFAQFTVATLKFFHGEGNRNIELLNGLVSIAYDTKGMNAGKLMDWIAVTVPHKIVRDKEKAERFLFAGKKKDAEYPDATTVELFLLENDKWHKFEGGASKTPKAYDAVADADRLIARLLEAGYDTNNIVALIKTEAPKVVAKIKAKKSA